MKRVAFAFGGGLVGMLLAYAAAFLVPETPYETVLGWMLWSAIGGAVVGALLGRA